MASSESRLQGYRATEHPGPGAAPAGTGPRPDERQLFVDGHNEFALALYERLVQESRNVFFSPLSIRTALGMARVGAKGETAVQMDRALRFESSEQKLRAAFAELTHMLNTGGGTAHEMSVANSLWAHDGAPLKREFTDVISRYYGGTTNIVDFCRRVEIARRTINRWVEDRTKQKIRELITQGGLSTETRLVIANAVYFKGTWGRPFLADDTSDEPFYLEDGRCVQIPLMHQQESMRYFETGDYQAVDLDYQGGDLSMLVLLPAAKAGLRNLEATLSIRMLNDCVARMSEREVELFLPKFRMTWGTAELKDELCALGMPVAFTHSAADFSGINGHAPPHKESLSISNVLHQAFVEVKEEGTEAVAATAVAMICLGLGESSLSVPVFRADRPFLFAIRHRRSRALLFLGRVADPTSE